MIRLVEGLGDALSGVLKAGHFVGDGLETGLTVSHLPLLLDDLVQQGLALLGQRLDLVLVLGLGSLSLVHGVASGLDLPVQLSFLGLEGRQTGPVILNISGNLANLLTEFSNRVDLSLETGKGSRNWQMSPITEWKLGSPAVKIRLCKKKGQKERSMN